MKFAKTEEDIETLLGVNNAVFQNYINQFSWGSDPNTETCCLEGRDVLAEVIIDPAQLFTEEHAHLLQMVKTFCWSFEKPLVTVRHVQAYDERVFKLLATNTAAEYDLWMHEEAMRQDDDTADAFDQMFEKTGFTKLDWMWQAVDVTPLQNYSNYEHMAVYSCCNPSSRVQQPPKYEIDDNGEVVFDGFNPILIINDPLNKIDMHEVPVYYTKHGTIVHYVHRFLSEGTWHAE